MCSIVLIEYANNWTKISFYLISFHLPYNVHLLAFLSGIVCYRLGAFSGCSSPWMANIQATHSSTIDSLSDIDDPAYFRSSVHLRSTPQTTSIDPHDRRFVPRPSTPYKCGKIIDIICLCIRLGKELIAIISLYTVKKL